MGSGNIVGYALADFTSNDPNAIGSITVLVRPGLSAATDQMNALGTLTANVNTLQGQVSTLSSRVNTLASQVAYLNQPNTFSGTSSAQLVIQNANGDSLLTADTAHMTITVTNMVVTGTLTVAGHLVTAGNTPVIVASPAACSSPLATISGTDTTGIITITTGTGCNASGELATVTFNTAYTTAPQVELTAANEAASLLPIYRNTAPTGFTLYIPSKASAKTTYMFSYFTAQ